MTTKFLTFDCETDPFKCGRVPQPFIWGAYSPDFGFKKFFHTEDFVNFLSEWKGIAYAHNGGKFDTHFLLDYIKDEQKKIMIVHGRIAKIKIGKCEIRDSYMNLPVALGKYQKDVIDYKLFEKESRQAHMPEIIKYLEGDCKYLYEILEKNFEDYGLKLTLAGTAFNYWLKNFKPEDLKETSGSRHFERFSQFYYGGRVQAFEKGVINKPFKIYDINSAYPYAMQYEHPIENSYVYSKKLDMENITKGFFEIEGIAKGCFPFRNKIGGLDFPDDGVCRLFKVTGWELKKALELGLFEIVKLHKAFYFVKTISFKGYVDHFYSLKCEAKENGNKGDYLLSKLYLNSLYGKFGQNPNKFKSYILKKNSKVQDFLDEYNFTCQLNDDVSIMEKDAPEFTKTFYCVATSASISGFVRAYMMEHLHKSKGLLYCDTDSIACESMEANFGDLKLGEWDCEGEFTHGAIGGKKMYCFVEASGKMKISSKGARLTGEQIFDIARGGVVKYNQEAPSFSIKSPPSFLSRNIKMT